MPGGALGVPGGAKGAKREPKWSQKGSKREPKGSQNETKMEPKTMQNSINKSNVFFIDFGAYFGSILVQFWHHFGIKS